MHMSTKSTNEQLVVVNSERVEGGVRTTIIAGGELHELPPVTAEQFVSVCRAFLPPEQRIERQET